MIVYLLIAASAFWPLWCVSSFSKNQKVAKTIGVPIVVSPIGPTNPFWLFFSRLVAPQLQRLPFSLGSFIRYNTSGWNYNDKYKMHHEFGKIFVHVSPSGNELFVADPAAADHILSRRKDFIKPISMLESVDLFGKSVASVDGADWQRHRRITAPPFNERNSGLVWVESLRQAKQMLDCWVEEGGAGVTSVTTDTSTLALHVITCAGFGISYHFSRALDTVREGFTMSYADSLYSVMKNLLLLMLLPSRTYSFPILPKALKDFKVAVADFKRYMIEMVDLAKARTAQTDSIQPNLLNTLVQKSEEVLAESGGTTTSSGLSDDEIYGNLFIFSFAGHETTASTLAYSIYLLATFPEYQEWVGQELDEVLRGHNSVETIDYEKTYPRLKRCLALMYETLRLYPQVLSIPKCTGDTPQVLKTEGREITIPPHTNIFPNCVALQTDPDSWGSDSLLWKPNRWIGGSKVLSAETFFTPIKGSYVPWSEGPRVCPGKKFSMVEFVSVITVLLWKHRIEVTPRAGETLNQARERVYQVVEDSAPHFTLQMRDPKSVGLKFVKR